MNKILPTPIEVIGKSGTRYFFYIYKIDEPFEKNIGGVYICINLREVETDIKNSKKYMYSLIYCGETHDFTERCDESHHKYDEIMSYKPNYICIKKIETKDERIKIETDILEGNSFPCNEQHN
jgi:hypothetical protein